MKIRFFSIQITKLTTLLTCWAKRCAGRLSCLLIWDTKTCWKSLNLCLIPSIILPIVAGNLQYSFIESETTFESHSNTTSRKPISQAKVTPSIAFASHSDGPSAQGIFLLKAAKTQPTSSLISHLLQRGTGHLTWNAMHSFRWSTAPSRRAKQGVHCTPNQSQRNSNYDRQLTSYIYVTSTILFSISVIVAMWRIPLRLRLSESPTLIYVTVSPSFCIHIYLVKYRPLL